MEYPQLLHLQICLSGHLISIHIYYIIAISWFFFSLTYTVKDCCVSSDLWVLLLNLFAKDVMLACFLSEYFKDVIACQQTWHDLCLSSIYCMACPFFNCKWKLTLYLLLNMFIEKIVSCWGCCAHAKSFWMFYPKKKCHFACVVVWHCTQPLVRYFNNINVLW